MQWKGWINGGEPFHKVFFECPDGALSDGDSGAVPVGTPVSVLTGFPATPFVRSP
jgi:hypothetical protein